MLNGQTHDTDAFYIFVCLMQVYIVQNTLKMQQLISKCNNTTTANFGKHNSKTKNIKQSIMFWVVVPNLLFCFWFVHVFCTYSHWRNVWFIHPCTWELLYQRSDFVDDIKVWNVEDYWRVLFGTQLNGTFQAELKILISLWWSPSDSGPAIPLQRWSQGWRMLTAEGRL